MKVSILTKILVVVMVLAIVPLVVLGVLSITNISNMEGTAVDEVDNMGDAVSADISSNTDAVSAGITDISDAVFEEVADVTKTAVEDSIEALNDLGVEFVYQKAADVARQMQIYLDANPDLTQSDLQGDTYLIYESPQSQQKGESPLYAGVHYGADNSEYLSLNSDWIVTYGGVWKRFVDDDGKVLDLTGKWIMNASDGSAGSITANTASTISAPLTSLGNPFAELDWDSGDDGFWSIAIQNINRETSDEMQNIGYLVLCDAGTGIPLAHPNPLVVGLPDHIGRSMYPLIYELMDQTIASGEPEMGTFPFDEDNDPNTPDEERFAVFYPVKDLTGKLITIMGPDPANPSALMERPVMVSAAVLLKNFNEPAGALEERLLENAQTIEAKLTQTTTGIEAGLTTSAAKIETDLRTNRDSVASEISDAKNSTQTNTIIVIVIVFLTVLVAAIWLSRVITNPLMNLYRGMVYVMEGNLGHRIGSESTDEVGQLSRAFDQMTDNIQKSQEELENTNANLEEMVESRTAELRKEVAERELAEQQVIQANKQLEGYAQDLERSNRELDDFAYIASHDLKEPLRGIHNYSSFLIEDYEEKLDEDGKSKLNTLMNLTRRLEALIDGLLYYSRVGRAELGKQEIDSSEIINDILETLESSLEEQSITVSMADDMPVVVCDRTKVGEVFRNLITNAMKYNDKDEKRIEVGWQKDKNDAPVFFVRDNGIGIKENNLPKVFKMFTRLHARDKYGGGTGSGLTLARKIILRHGGDIWVESEVGKGTTFYFNV